jgi:hypothetical protein
MLVSMNMNQIGIQQQIPISEDFFRRSLTCEAVFLIQDDTAVRGIRGKLKIVGSDYDCLASPMHLVEKTL